MTVELLYIIIAIGMLIGAIVVSFLLAKDFTKGPSIRLLQGSLKDEGDVDINDAIHFLKLTNLEENVEIPHILKVL